MKYGVLVYLVWCVCVCVRVCVRVVCVCVRVCVRGVCVCVCVRARACVLSQHSGIISQMKQ